MIISFILLVPLHSLSLQILWRKLGLISEKVNAIKSSFFSKLCEKQGQKTRILRAERNTFD